MENKEHWENVFSTKTEKEVSWYQEYPQISVNFVEQFQLPLNAKIIDIGGGDSYFIDALLDLGYSNLYLLDISKNAIERIKIRLGKNASKVTFIISDILDFQPEIQFDFWHDRACFHFLTTKNEIEKYQEIISKSIAVNGKMVIGTFSENGPKKCSGLEISQYSDEKLKQVFDKNFEFINSEIMDHKTPFETIQNFVFCSFNKNKKMKNILVLCTGNSCRSQIAHGFLEKLCNKNNVKIYSAGVETHGVNPKAIAIMQEIGIDISGNTSNNIDEYLDINFDYVITVCDNAKERCPFFPTKAIQLHYNFPDPGKAIGTENEILNEFRLVREMIKKYCEDFIDKYKL